MVPELDSDNAIALTVLVVDDDLGVHEQARDELVGIGPGVRLLHAIDPDEAADLAACKHVDLAFIDLHLGNRSGVEVVNELAEVAPSCEIVVITRYHGMLEVDEAARLIAPGSPVAGVVNKSAQEAGWFSPMVRDRYQSARARTLSLSGLTSPGGLVHALVTKRERINWDLADPKRTVQVQLRDHIDEVELEVNRLFERLFGHVGGPDVKFGRGLSCRVLRSGYSSSVVAEVAPEYVAQGGQVSRGLSTIVKVGPTPEIIAEVDRYYQAVQHAVQGSSRVELLGSARGDALSMLCYSFASESPAELMTLQEWLVDCRVQRKQVRKLLGRVASEELVGAWPVERMGMSILQYVQRERGVTLLKGLKVLEEWLQHMAEDLEMIDILDATGSQDDQNFTKVVRVKGQNLCVPRSPLLGSTHVRRMVPNRMLHGDLHGGNVMLDTASSPPTFKLIDYRNTGPGPRYFDAAALEASIRLAEVGQWWCGLESGHLPPDDVIAVVVERYAGVELRQVARDAVEDPLGARDDNWWVGATTAVSGAALNTPDGARVEYVWTCFAHCLAMFTIESLGMHERTRLLVWLSALTRDVVQIEGDR